MPDVSCPAPAGQTFSATSSGTAHDCAGAAVGLGLAGVAAEAVADPEAVAADDLVALAGGAGEVPPGAVTFAQTATTTVPPDSSALPPSPDRSEK